MSKLPILMYHNITNQVSKADKFTLHIDLLDKQFAYLVKNGYQTHFLQDLQKTKKLVGKNVVLTFDDVTKNQLDFAIPLLRKYQLKATFFIPFAYVGKTDEWNEGLEPIMTVEELKQIEADFEFGFHSFSHRKYGELTAAEIDEDFQLCSQFIQKHQLTVNHLLAYPFGNFPKSVNENKIFIEKLKKYKITYGLRIGNRINEFPFKNPFEINRLDIKGNESFFKFKWKLKFGKLF